MPSSGYSWTEPLPRPYNTLGTNIRSAKTAPAAPLLVRDASPDSLISMFNEDENNMEWASSPNPDNDHLVLDDPESDISSASGCSASVSLVSSPSFEPALDSAVVPSLLSESHENTTYASRMHMSQFQREKDQFRWDLFVQRIKEGLPEKFTHQNKFFQLINFGGSGNLYATAFTVHRYYDTLAIKVLRSKKIAPIIDLPNEFQIMRDLKHNHIVAFVGTFSRNGQFGVLMYPLAICNLAEFLKDASEKKYSDSRQRFDQWKSILTTAFGCLSSALIYLHMTRRIKHKDIKPENILVDRYGSVLLSDFGISKQYEDETITEGTTPFTDKYAPPEVVHQHKRDLSSDIFSLGCVFLEMATVVLGESLEDLTSSLFDPNRRQSYREARPRIIDWVDRLKRIVRREAATSYSETFRSYTNSNLVRVQNLGVPHLDAVLSMMSISPRNRPPISKVHELFKGFASHCLECQDAHLVRSCNHQSESKIQVLPATLEEARAVDQNRSSLQALERQAFTLSNRAVKDNGQGYQNKPETSKSDSPMDIDETESACPSEAESLHSDSDSADDFRPRLHVGSERHAVLLQARIQPWLEQNKELILSSLHQNDNLDHCVRQCPANSSSGRSNGSSGSRRQGSPIKGPPDKRRSIENRRVLPLRNGDDNGGSDGEDDPDRGRDKSSNVDFNGSPRSRMFACPFYQRERSRHTNRSCQGPGWTNFHRVK
ncbi:kinase-like protein [Lojkania enalia]|uniref:Kinase-like protein n=1 Tax=Lojkania enalia TaxID=147567 RepID=A0A9P4N7K7_9PLEO|nr:kinase-like protein [Didymosphaeria enalia]